MLLYEKREDDKGGEKANRCGKLWEDCNNRGQEPGPPSGAEMIRVGLQSGGIKKNMITVEKLCLKQNKNITCCECGDVLCVSFCRCVKKARGFSPLFFLTFGLRIPFPSILFMD